MSARLREALRWLWVAPILLGLCLMGWTERALAKRHTRKHPERGI